MDNTPFFRTPYNYDMLAASKETGLKCEDVSKTQQQFKDDADINVIVERMKVGYIPPTNLHMPLSGDFEGLTSFKDAMNEIRRAQETFNALPAKVRARFHNEPDEFVQFCSDPENKDEAIKLGLAERPPEPVQSPQVPVPTGSTAPAPSEGTKTA